MDIICEKYTILKCLHQTDANIVYLTEHMGLQTKRIVKKMKKENNFQLPEIEILKRLSHPNIPKIIDVLEDDEFVYLIREYAQGKNLEEWMAEKNSFGEEQLIHIASQLADVLSYLHEGFDRPIIYRDLKPENIILDTNGYLTLIDFGIARYANPERTQDTNFLGTKAYAAPEQFGAFRSDEKSDIYAFGMTLYYLLSHHQITSLPYQRKEMRAWLKVYSEDLVKLIYECSEPKREKRPQSFAEIKERLSVLGMKREMKPQLPDHAALYLGIRPGAGTSFVTYAHAFAAAQSGQRVAILDWSERQQITKLSLVAEEAEIKKHSFGIDKMEIYPLNKNQSSPANWQDYDWIFIDGGVLTSEKRKRFAEYRQNIWLVCSGASWDMVDLDDMMFNEQLIEWRFLLNLAEDGLLEKLQQDYPETEFVLFPYQQSLYSYAAGQNKNKVEIVKDSWFNKMKEYAVTAAYNKKVKDRSGLKEMDRDIRT